MAPRAVYGGSGIHSHQRCAYGKGHAHGGGDGNKSSMVGRGDDSKGRRLSRGHGLTDSTTLKLTSQIQPAYRDSRFLHISFGEPTVTDPFHTRRGIHQIKGGFALSRDGMGSDSS